MDKSIRWHFFALIFCIVAVVWVVYAPTLAGQFLTWDDDINITRNGRIQSFTAENLRWMFSDVQHALRYKPLSWLAWAILYHFWNLNPLPYHVANLVLHCFNSVFLFLLIRHLLQLWFKSIASPAALWAAAFGTLTWAIHPLRVEPVAWITGLPYELSLFFLQISLLFYLRSQSPAGTAFRRGTHFWISVAAFAASLLSYPIGVGYFLVLMIIDTFVLHRVSSINAVWREREARRALLEKIPFALLTMICAGLTLFGRFVAHGMWSPAQGIEQFGWVSRVMQAFYIWAYYAWKFWLPFDLAPAYGTLIVFSPSSPPFLLSAGMVVGTTVVLFHLRRRWPAALALWLCHLVLLLPALGLTEHPHYPSDRYGFIPNVTWAIFLAGGTLWLLRKWPRGNLIAGLAVCLLFFFGALSFNQGFIWRNTVALLEHTLRIYGTNPHVNNLHLRLGSAYLAGRDFARASEHFRKQLETDHNNIQARLGLGSSLFYLGDLDHAAIEYSEILKLSPADSEMHNRLGAVFAAQGDWQNATNQFFAALAINPELDSALFNLGRVLQIQGHTNEANACFEKAEKVVNARNRSPR